MDPFVRRKKVPRRVLEPRGVVVIAAEDEHPGAVQQRPKCAHHRRHRLPVREIVTRIDHKVRVELVQGGHPALLGPLTGQHVQIRQVQHPQRPGPRRQHRQGGLPQRPVPALDAGRVRQRRGAERGGTQRDPADVSCHRAHGFEPSPAARVPLMAELKARLQADLTAAMKNREKVKLSTLRMALAGISTEEVSGDTARELTDDEVQRVLTREVLKRKEAAEAFAGAGRAEQAKAELDEAEVLADYLPKQLDDDELATLVSAAVAEVTEQLGAAPGQKQMGQVMKAANARVAGRAEGGRVAAAVRALLTG